MFPVACITIEAGDVKGFYEVAVSDSLKHSAIIGLDLGWEAFRKFIDLAIERCMLGVVPSLLTLKTSLTMSLNMKSPQLISACSKSQMMSLSMLKKRMKSD